CRKLQRKTAMPGILLGDVLPNFDAETTIGKIKFHEFLGNSSTTDFKHIRMISEGSCDTEDWSNDDIVSFNQDKTCCPVPFPIIADDKRELSVLLGMLDPDERDKDGMPLTARCVFVVGPDKRLKLSILYPATTGRNFDEILRVIDSLQLTATKKVATPVDWKPGQEVMVIPSLSDEEANKLFPAGFTLKEVPSGKKYMRYTKL
uniref:Peroxiredoxin 6 n=1 Tax=Sinocyclocheilus grahami TaxID=75366 RepID=A0A672KBH3_SINGR